MKEFKFPKPEENDFTKKIHNHVFALKSKMDSNINEFCRNVDPTKYVLCQKLELDGTIKHWFEPKEPPHA